MPRSPAGNWLLSPDQSCIWQPKMPDPEEPPIPGGFTLGTYVNALVEGVPTYGRVNGYISAAAAPILGIPQQGSLVTGPGFEAANAYLDFGQGALYFSVPVGRVRIGEAEIVAISVGPPTNYYLATAFAAQLQPMFDAAPGQQVSIFYEILEE